MITLQEFAEAVRRKASNEGFEYGETCFVDSCETSGYEGTDAVAWWSLESAAGSSAQDYFERSLFAAAVYPDGSAQLLSRDEEERRLFATLLELEK